MSTYSDNQEIEDLIVDISISLEEADKATLTLGACQAGLQKNTHKLKYLVSELKDKDLATKYIKQVNDILLTSLINQTQIELKNLIGQRDE